MERTTLKEFIPETKVEAVNKALQSAFGTTTVKSIVTLAGGLSSALVYKIVVHGNAYVLRIIMQIDPLNDPTRQFICMNVAAEAGVAPRVHYANAEDAVSIIDFIETVPWAGYIDSRDHLLEQLAKTIRTIHATPPFPPLVNFLDGIDGFIQEFKASKMLPESATAEHFRYYAQIQQVYPRHDPDLVSSHNDLNFGNILFDGKKIWLIDWEAAFQNDRFVDLAMLAGYFATNEAQEEVFLQAYFGDTLDEYKKARLFLMQQVNHMFYAMLMMKFAAASKPAGWKHDDNMETPTLTEFRRLLDTDEVSLATYEGKLLYGKVSLNAALHNMKSPRFADAINKVKHHQ